MGIFNNKGLAQSLAARVQGRATAGTAQPQNGFARMAQNAISSIPQRQSQLGLNQNGFSGMAQNALANRAAAPISAMQPTAISPTAFTNQGAITGLFGAENPGTFTRTVGETPLTQMADPGYMPMEDPSMTGADVALDEYGQPVPPPMGVQTPITPNYDLNAQ